MKFPGPSCSLVCCLTFLCLGSARLLSAEETKPVPEQAKGEIAALLHDFLAQNNDPARHDRFWAEDLVYTSSLAEVTDKAKIMKAVREDAAATQANGGKPKTPTETYSAEDVLVRPYGDMAALTFRLVAHESGGATRYYRNSGTFLRRNGQWQAVTWQATKVPPPESKPAT